MRRHICFYLVVIAVLVLASCQSVPISKAAKVVEPERSYVVVRFQGPVIDLVIVELNTRERIVLALKNTDKLQAVPVPPGEYAIKKISGDRPLLASMVLGSAKYYIAVPLQLMRIIDVQPGDSVYLGELDLRRTVDLNPMVDGEVRYVYDPASAIVEFEELFGTNHGTKFTGIDS